MVSWNISANWKWGWSRNSNFTRKKEEEVGDRGYACVFVCTGCGYTQGNIQKYDGDCDYGQKRPNNLYDRKHKKKSSPITRTRRDQTLSVTQLALFQMYTRRQSSYITMFKRTPLVWALCICTRCGIKLVYIEDFHLSMLLFLKTILSVVNSLCYKESRTVNFIIVSQYREKGIKLKYKMTYQICLTGTNSLWSIPHHNFIGRQTIHIYRSGSRLLLFCL